ncbi:hypothetical protein AB0D04_38890 [Streptomyces sp. NPDC048483]|uniref:hypothetical protein n=1 Tax=Streptomyces sp. NPDC048483 TaxID=3154927 RepID=UPI003416C17D
MGWTILYIAFGLVAVWLLAEVLLQYKARLRWRLLAFVGFLGVVVGVVLPQVIVIGAGLIAFAFGQTQVTLSFRRGFSTGWALGGKPGESRRRRARPGAAPAAEPTLQVSDLEAVPVAENTGQGDEETVFAGPNAFRGGQDAAAGQNAFGGGQEAYGAQSVYGAPDPYDAPNAYDAQGLYDGQTSYDAQRPYTGESPYAGQGSPAGQEMYAGQGSYDTAAVYAPQPMPDETGAYGIYSPDARIPQPGSSYDAYDAYDAYGTAPGNADSDGNGYAYDGGYGQNPAGQDTYADPYTGPYAAYGDSLGGQGQQAPYSDPYIGNQQYAAPYDPYQQPDPYGQAPYADGQYDGQNLGQGYSQTPPGGVWVPQQRDGELPPEQPPYPPYQQQGYDEQQYRY